MTSDLKVTFLIITMNRFEDLKECIESIQKQEYDNFEIIVVDNDSDYEDYKTFSEKYENKDCVRIIRSEKNRGVSGGRNLGLNQANGDIIITIDDDAIIRDNSLTSNVVKRFKGEDEVGVLSFKIINYYSGEVDPAYFPSKNKKRSKDDAFETTWFIGAGHAIKREVYDNVGLYRDYFPYGHEELDMSLRILDHGYRIIYFPQAEIFHKESPKSRILSESSDFYANQLSKRIQVAVQNLPWRYVISTSLVRTIQYLVRSGFNVYAILWAYWRLFSRWNEITNDRRVISKKTISKVIDLKGPVLY